MFFLVLKFKKLLKNVLSKILNEVKKTKTKPDARLIKFFELNLVGPIS